MLLQEGLLTIKPPTMMKAFMETFDPADQIPLIIENDDVEYSTLQENIREGIFIAKNTWKGTKFDDNKAKTGPAEMAGEFAYILSQGDKSNKTLIADAIVKISSDTTFHVPCILDAEHKVCLCSVTMFYSV